MIESEVFEAALSKAAAGNDPALQAFGIERLTLVPQSVEERLVIEGSGRASMSTDRSLADLGGYEIGEFRGALEKKAVQELASLLLQMKLAKLGPFPASPGGIQVRISAVAGGASQQAIIGTADPAALDTVRPLLSKLDAIAGEVHKKPVASLSLTAEFPSEGIRAGKVSLRMALVFRNGGSEGIYISHPAAGSRCALVYGFKEDLPPDVTPLPMELQEAILKPALRDPPPYLYVPPGNEAAVGFEVTLLLEKPGKYLARASYTDASPGSTVAGRRKLRGAVFSADTAFKAS